MKNHKKFISKTIRTHLDQSNSSILLPKIDGINAKSILLVKGLDADMHTHKWLSII